MYSSFYTQKQSQRWDFKEYRRYSKIRPGVYSISPLQVGLTFMWDLYSSGPYTKIKFFQVGLIFVVGLIKTRAYIRARTVIRFQFRLTLSTLNFCPLALSQRFSKTLALRGNFNFSVIFILKPLLELPNQTTTLPRPALCSKSFLFNLDIH